MLVKRGYGGPIYTSPATCDLCVPMLADTAHIQEMDAMFLNKRKSRRRLVDPDAGDGPIEPLYTTEDAEAVYPLLHGVNVHTPTEVGPGVTYTTYEAGHMLGSTSVLLEAKDGGKTVRLGFSGDVGRVGLPIITDPEPLPPVDYLIMESTYGDRLHQDMGPVKTKLAGIINRTANRGGKIVVPAFAVGRTQQLVLLMHELINEDAIPNIPIFVDSPLAVNVTEIFRKHRELWDKETQAMSINGDDPFGFKRLRYIRDVNESKALNDIRSPFMVISASGMCEAGRILHHLRNSIEDARNAILIVGFQAENTLGRRLLRGDKVVNIFGEPHPVRAEVFVMNEYSAHADRDELLAWFHANHGTPREVFAVHGEEEQSQAFAERLRREAPARVHVPLLHECFGLGGRHGEGRGPASAEPWSPPAQAREKPRRGGLRAARARRAPVEKARPPRRHGARRR